MSIRNYGIYHQGVIFYMEDFDPAKVIQAVCEKIYNIILPDNIKNALTNNKFDFEIFTELCALLDINVDEIDNIERINDYSYISHKLVADAEYDEWFNGTETLMGTDKASVFIFSEIEGEYIYDNNEKETETVTDCYMLSLDFPAVWEINDYIVKNNGYRSRGEILRLICKTVQPLLKDGIEWENRLGYLIGSTYG